MKRQTLLKSTLCLLMALVCNVAWAQTVVTAIDVSKFYTLQCTASDHSANSYIGYNGSVTIDGKSPEAKAAYLVFEKADGENQYYIKSPATGKYISYTGSGNTLKATTSKQEAHAWILNEPDLTANGSVTFKAVNSTNRYLNNAGASGDGFSNLQAREHNSPEPNTGNACSVWKLREYDFAMPTVSDTPENGKWAESTTWYQIKTGNGYYFRSDVADVNGYLQLTDDKSKNAAVAKESLWCITGNEADGYVFYNYAKGPTVALSMTDNSRAHFVEGKTTAFDFVKSKKTGADYWSAKEHGSETKYWNRSSGYLSYWNSAQAVQGWPWTGGDDGSALLFTEPVMMDFSTFSSEAAPKWFSVQFATGGNFLSDKGNGNKLLTAAACDSYDEFWMFEGDWFGFTMKSRMGNYVYLDGDRFKTTKTKDNATKFTFVYNASFDAWELQRIGATNTMNQVGDIKVGQELGEWTKGDKNNPFFLEEAVLVPNFPIEGIASYTPDSPLTLWYKNAASNMNVSDQWMEYSLPIGNGQFGASIFGGVSREQVQFNEKTLWSGSKDNYATANYGDYENFGSLYIQDISGVFGDDKPVKDYYRQLDLSNATASVHYKSTDGAVTYTREYIASEPDQVVAMRLKADKAGQISIKVTLASGKPGVRAKTTYNEGTATFGGKLETVTYNALAKVVNTGGTMTTDTKGITVTGADEVFIILGGATDFTNTTATYTNGTADQLPSIVAERVNAAAAKDWNTLYTAHVDDYKEFFDRCNFVLEGAANTMPTDDLIKQYAKRSTGMEDYALMLEQLYFAYGRYLEIGSSRGVDLPSNLQGIWNNSSEPAWNSDIHANINVQMNYWPAEPTNLSELHMPFLNYIIKMANSAEWKDIATNPSKANQPRGWAFLTENNIFGGTGSFQKSAYINNAWYVSHLWQHYRYTLDEEFLERAFPAMWSAAMFWMDRLKLADDGTYVCPYEYSPEHGPNEDGVAHAQQLVWELFSNTLSTVEVLGQKGVDALATEYKDVYDTDLATLKDRFANLDEGLAIETYTPNGETGKWGEGAIKYGSNLLREWKYSNYYAGANGHRHMSHMMCLYPFNQITEGTDFFDAAINSMKLRGDASTGWSMGWKINLWARALDGDHSHDILELALRHHSVGGGGVYYNLYDAHTPFQIDGNFGACAGIAEMLMQSHTEVINILPALPSVWKKGSIKGLKAVGNFTVDIEWEGGQARKVVITNHKGQPCYVKCDNLAQATVTVVGNPYTLGEETNHNGLSCYQIVSGAGEEIVIDLSNATQKDKSELETLIAQTQALVDQCYDYYATEAPLQANEPTGAYYVSTNADQNTGGGNKDGAGIAGLVDNTTGTYFHSRWGGTVTVDEPHYIKIDLGNEKTLTSLRFKYVAHSAPDPKTIVVEGSNSPEDGYETIETITKAITAVGEEYVSPIINSATPYRYLRFKVTLSERSGYGAKWNNQYLFAMKEFDLMPRLEVPVTTFPDSKLVPAAATAATEAIVVAEEAVEATQTASEYKVSLAALQAKYDELNAAMQSGSLPVLVSLDTDKPFVYKIGIKREANLTNPVLEYDYANTKMVAVKTYDADNKNHGWYFTKGTADNQVFIHPYLGGGDVLASNSLGDGKEKVKGMPKNSQGYTQEWTLHLYNEENGIYNIKPVSTTNTYFSNNGGWQQKMGFWANETDSPKDGGSQFMFEPITIDGDIWKHCLDAYKNYICTTPSYDEREGLGYYQGAAAYNTARSTAVEVLANETSTSEDYKNAYTALRSAKEALSFNVPAVGKFYRLKGKASEKYMSTPLSTDAANRVKMRLSENPDDAGCIFYLTANNKLLSFKLGTFLCNTHDISAIGENNGNTISFNPSESGTGGYFTLKTDYSGSKYIYDDKDETEVDRNGSYTANNCEWAIEEVTALPFTISSVDYGTLYAPVALEIPDHVKAYTGVVDGDYLVLTKITEKAIPANTGVVIYHDEGSYGKDEVPTGATTHNFAITSSTETLESDFSGSVATFAKTGTLYTLQTHGDGVAFKQFSGTHITGFKAYLEFESEQPAQALRIRFAGENHGGTTSLESSELNAQGSALIYDLQGRRVLNPTKGMYIVNGKKMVIK